MQQYLDLMQDILDNGYKHEDRTGTGRCSVFGRMLRFNLEEGFPLVTTRKINYTASVHELLWHISGNDSLDYLHENNVHIWDHWAVNEKHIDEFLAKNLPASVSEIPGAKEFLIGRFYNKVGNIYGKNWRALTTSYNPLKPCKAAEDYTPEKLATIQVIYDDLDPEVRNEIGTFEEFIGIYSATIIDQLEILINNLKYRPYSSRHVISSWVPEFIPNETLSPQENVMLGYGALAPCPTLQQFIVTPNPEGKPKLSLMLTQRSCDVPVGGAFNIAQYSLFLAMIAQVVDMQPYEFIWSLGDAHIYLDQLELVQEQLQRNPLPLPQLELNPEIKDIDIFTIDDIKVLNYQYHPAIKYPVSI